VYEKERPRRVVGVEVAERGERRDRARKGFRLEDSDPMCMCGPPVEFGGTAQTLDRLRGRSGGRRLVSSGPWRWAAWVGLDPGGPPAAPGCRTKRAAAARSTARSSRSPSIVDNGAGRRARSRTPARRRPWRCREVQAARVEAASARGELTGRRQSNTSTSRHSRRSTAVQAKRPCDGKRPRRPSWPRRRLDERSARARRSSLRDP